MARLIGNSLVESDLLHLRSSNVLAPPVTSTQEYLCDLFKEILSLDVIGIDSNFFDLGGHSLLLMQVTIKVLNRFNVELEVVKFIQLGTVRQIAQHIDDLLEGDGMLSTPKPLQFSARKPRLLCLHGAGANPSVTSIQIEGLNLSSRFECTFLKAPHTAKYSHREKDERFSGPFYTWADSKKSTESSKKVNGRKFRVSSRLL